LRRQALAAHVQAVRDLIELNEEALSARNRGEPEDWERLANLHCPILQNSPTVALMLIAIII